MAWRRLQRLHRQQPLIRALRALLPWRCWLRCQYPTERRHLLIQPPRRSVQAPGRMGLPGPLCACCCLLPGLALPLPLRVCCCLLLGLPPPPQLHACCCLLLGLPLLLPASAAEAPAGRS